MVWRLVVGAISTGIGMLVGAVFGALAFGRGTLGAELAVVSAVLGTAALSGIGSRRSSVFTTVGSHRLKAPLVHQAESSSRCHR